MRKRLSSRRSRSLPLSFSLSHLSITSVFFYLYLSICFSLSFPCLSPSLRSNSFLPSSSVLFDYAGFDGEYLSFVTGVSAGRMADRRKTTRRRTGAAPSLPHPFARALVADRFDQQRRWRWRSGAAQAPSAIPISLRHRKKRSSRQILLLASSRCTGSPAVLSNARGKNYSRQPKADVFFFFLLLRWHRSTGDL